MFDGLQYAIMFDEIATEQYYDLTIGDWCESHPLRVDRPTNIVKNYFYAKAWLFTAWVYDRCFHLDVEEDGGEFHHSYDYYDGDE